MPFRILTSFQLMRRKCLKFIPISSTFPFLGQECAQGEGTITYERKKWKWREEGSRSQQIVGKRKLASFRGKEVQQPENVLEVEVVMVVKAFKNSIQSTSFSQYSHSTSISPSLLSCLSLSHLSSPSYSSPSSPVISLLLSQQNLI